MSAEEYLRQRCLRHLYDALYTINVAIKSQNRTGWTMIPNAIQTDCIPVGYIEVYGRKSSANLIRVVDGDAPVTTINCITLADAAGRRGRHLATA